MAQFRVVDLRTTTLVPDVVVEAPSPENAAAQVLGEKVVRGGQSLRRLLCRVYWHERNGKTSMVRLYRLMAIDAPQVGAAIGTGAL